VKNNKVPATMRTYSKKNSQWIRNRRGVKREADSGDSDVGQAGKRKKKEVTKNEEERGHDWQPQSDPSAAGPKKKRG